MNPRMHTIGQWMMIASYIIMLIVNWKIGIPYILGMWGLSAMITSNHQEIDEMIEEIREQQSWRG